jgi:hypothetical protein
LGIVNEGEEIFIADKCYVSPAELDGNVEGSAAVEFDRGEEL